MDDPEAVHVLPCVKLRPICLAIATACILAFLVAPLIGAGVALAFAPLGVGVLVAMVAIAFVAVLGYAMSSSYLWIELDDGIIRGRRLLTRRIVEFKVNDIVDARPLNTNALGPAQNAILDALLKTSNRGYLLLFRDGTRLPLIRADMSGLDEFLEALAEQMAHNRQESANGPGRFASPQSGLARSGSLAWQFVLHRGTTCESRRPDFPRRECCVPICFFSTGGCRAAKGRPSAGRGVRPLPQR